MSENSGNVAERKHGNAKLAPGNFRNFIRDSEQMSTHELAAKYGLRERTAYNWKKRLLNERAPGDQSEGDNTSPNENMSTIYKNTAEERAS